MNFQKIEKEIERLIQIDTEIWNDFHFQSRTDIEKNYEVYLQAVSSKVRSKVSMDVIYGLEDENHHSFIEALEVLNLVK
jgi:hypothetical protein